MIEVKNLNKSFVDKEVIVGMDFKFTPGSIFGLIGINGAGKSTLLRLLSGVIIPNSGEILIDGININKKPEAKKKLFYLSDDPPYNAFTTLNDLRKMYSVFYDFDGSIFEEIIEIFKLDPKRPISKFSKGMRRQGFIALAFATKAPYLLFDEVFDGLDPKARLIFKQYMVKNFDEDQIIIITSHSLRELEDICDSFGMISDGHFKKFGTIDSEIEKVKKYQIVLKNENDRIDNKAFKIIYQKQEGRVVTIVTERLDKEISEYFNKDFYLAIDELPLSFEEYFIISQGGEVK